MNRTATLAYQERGGTRAGWSETDHLRFKILPAVIFCLGTGCERPLRPGEKLAPQVSVSIVRKGELPTLLELSGEVSSTHKAVVNSQQSGIVEQVECRVGQRVNQGQVILRLRPGRTEADVHQAEASVSSAQAQVAQARINVEIAHKQNLGDIAQAQQQVRQAEIGIAQARTQLQANQSDRDRNKDLLNQKAVAKFDYEQSQLKVVMAEDGLKTAQSKADAARAALAQARQGEARVRLEQAQVDQARASLGQAEASLEAARIGASGSVVYAPATGVVTERKVEVGQAVGAGGDPLITIMEDQKAEIVAVADSRYAPQLRPGLLAQLSSTLYQNRKFQARLISLAPAGDVQSNTIKIRFKPENLPHDILNGTAVRLSMNLGNHRGILLPLAAVQGETTKDEWAWGIREQKVQRVALKIVHRDESTGLVEKGLSDGEAVVTSGGESLNEGDQVRVVTVKEPYSP